MKNRFVLVATPEPSTQEQLSTVLTEWGYEPVCAGSLEDALPEIAQRRFTLSLLDLGSGSGELLRRLKTQGGSPGAIVVSPTRMRASARWRRHRSAPTTSSRSRSRPTISRT